MLLGRQALRSIVVSWRRWGGVRVSQPVGIVSTVGRPDVYIWPMSATESAHRIDRTAEGPADYAIPEPWILRVAVLAYLVFLPVGHILAIPVNGTMASGSDVFLGFVLLAGMVELGRMSGPYFAGRIVRPAPLPGRRSFRMAALLMVAFSAWVALGVTWGFHPAYAMTKGVAFGALGLGALAIVWCGAEWETAADAWLLGTTLCLIVTWIGLLTGADWLQTYALDGGWSIGGVRLLPVSGPFPNASMLGDYLVLSGAILWARWDAVREVCGRGTIFGAWVLAGTLFLTVSSAWLGAGVLLIAMGLLTFRQRDGLVVVQRNRLSPVMLVVAGVILFTVTLAGLLVPITVDLAGFSIAGSGIRPEIWASALEAFKEAPVKGVGASPFLAVVADSFNEAGTANLWDSHSIYLSVLGQFGLVGAALLTGAIGMLTWTLVREGASRRHAVLIVALFAAGIHGVVIANEEFRHLWASLGLVGLAGVPRWARGQWWRQTDHEPRSVTGRGNSEVLQE